MTTVPAAKGVSQLGYGRARLLCCGMLRAGYEKRTPHFADWKLAARDRYEQS